MSAANVGPVAWTTSSATLQRGVSLINSFKQVHPWEGFKKWISICSSFGKTDSISSEWGQKTSSHSNSRIIVRQSTLKKYFFVALLQLSWVEFEFCSGSKKLAVGKLFWNSQQWCKNLFRKRSRKRWIEMRFKAMTGNLDIARNSNQCKQTFFLFLLFVKCFFLLRRWTMNNMKDKFPSGVSLFDCWIEIGSFILTLLKAFNARLSFAGGAANKWLDQ